MYYMLYMKCFNSSKYMLYIYLVTPDLVPNITISNSSVCCACWTLHLMSSCAQGSLKVPINGKQTL